MASCRHGLSRASTGSRSTPSSCRWGKSPFNPRRARAAAAAVEDARDRQRRRARRRREETRIFSTKRACRSCGRSFPELDPRLFSYNSKHGWCPACYGTGLRIDDVEWSDERARTGAEDNVLDSWIEWLEIEEACPECEGRRLNREALAVRWQGRASPSTRSNRSMPEGLSRAFP